MKDVFSVIEMVLGSGHSPFAAWFDGIDSIHAAKIVTALTRMRQGNTANAKALGGGVWEYKINWGPGIRIYFGWDGETIIVLLGGGSKKRQKDDIDRAKALWREYQKRQPASSKKGK